MNNSKKAKVELPKDGEIKYKSIEIKTARMGTSLRSSPLLIDFQEKSLIKGKFEKSIYINLLNNNMKYFTTNMQCTSIYHSKECIICIGSGQKKHYSQCFYIPIIKGRFGKKINLAICDGRELLVFNNNLFILCVSDKHIYIENFLSNDRIYHYIDNINPPCRGCILYDNKIIISSLKRGIYILNIHV
jgi:hypothetical protein